MGTEQKYAAVVIGVSSGGMNALRTLLSVLPPAFPLPVIILQHVGAHSNGDWIALLDKSGQMKLKEADEKEKIEGGNVYIAPANYHLHIEKDHTFSLSVTEKVNYARPSIDVLFESAADAYADSLIGIVLTGSSSDGTKGLKRIKEKGGLTIVQDPATAESPFMPASAIASVKVDHILSLENIATLLIQIAEQPKTLHT